VDPNRRPTRILWGSPLPPVHSGVADYAAELLPELAKLVRVRVLRPPRWDEPPDWPEDLELVHQDTRAEPLEIEILHLGNNPHHTWLLPRLRSGGAVVVLHDAVLHHLLVEFARTVTADGVLDRELAGSHGAAGEALVAARNAGFHGRLDPFLFPARHSFLRHASAVVVHSDWAADQVSEEFAGLPVLRVPLTAVDPAPTDREEERSRLGIGTGEVVLMHLGFLTPEKGMEAILTGFAAAVRSGVPARLVVAGEGLGADTLRAAATRCGVSDRLTLTGWIEPSRFHNVPAAADLGVVYRTPSAGETSAAALRFMACGVPVAVGGRRQFLELPECAAPRLTPGAAAAADLARLLAEINQPGWSDRRRASRLCYERSHRPERVAEVLMTELERFQAL